MAHYRSLIEVILEPKEVDWEHVQAIVMNDSQQQQRRNGTCSLRGALNFIISRNPPVSVLQWSLQQMTGSSSSTTESVATNSNFSNATAASSASTAASTGTDSTSGTTTSSMLIPSTPLLQEALLEFQACPRPLERHTIIPVIPLVACCIHQVSWDAFHYILQQTQLALFQTPHPLPQQQQQSASLTQKLLNISYLELIPLERLQLLWQYFPFAATIHEIDAYLLSPTCLDNVAKLQYILHHGLMVKLIQRATTSSSSKGAVVRHGNRHSRKDRPDESTMFNSDQGNDDKKKNNNLSTIPSLLPHLFLTYILRGPQRNNSPSTYYAHNKIEFWQRISMLTAAPRLLNQMHSRWPLEFHQVDPRTGLSCLGTILFYMDGTSSSSTFMTTTTTSTNQHRRRLDETLVLPLVQSVLQQQQQQQSNKKNNEEEKKNVAMIPFPQNGRLPLHVAIEKGFSWNIVQEILLAAPNALELPCPVTCLYPFQLAAASISWGSNDSGNDATTSNINVNNNRRSENSLESKFAFLKSFASQANNKMLQQSTTLVVPSTTTLAVTDMTFQLLRQAPHVLRNVNDNDNNTCIAQKDQLERQWALLDLKEERSKVRHYRELKAIQEERQKLLRQFQDNIDNHFGEVPVSSMTIPQQQTIGMLHDKQKQY